MSPVPTRKWLVAGVFVLTLFVVLLDQTITNVALPTLRHVFGSTTTETTWVVTGYLLSTAVSIPVSGWLGDRWGSKPTFLVALAIFTLGSLCCGLATSLATLVVFRVMQGIGGGLLTPVGSAMLFRAFAVQERARVASLITIPSVVAPALGPIVGGYFVQAVSWHWIFLLNVPIGIVGLALASRGLPNYRVIGTGRLDIAGFFLAGGGLTALIYALAEVGPRGFTDSQVLWGAASGTILLTCFLFVELRQAHPLIDVRLFTERLFLTSSLILFFVQGGFFGITFLLPQLLQVERGFSPLDSGLTTFTTSIGIMMGSPLVGRLYRPIGPRRLVMGGLTLAGIVAVALHFTGMHTDPWVIRGQMGLLGIAFGFVFIPLQTISFARIAPERLGQASAAYTAVRQIATSCGVAFIATVLSRSLTAQHAVLGSPTTQTGALQAFGTAFLAVALMNVAGLGIALFISDRLAAATRKGMVTTSREEVRDELLATQALIAE